MYKLIAYLLPVLLMLNVWSEPAWAYDWSWNYDWSEPAWAWQPYTVVQQGGAVSTSPGVNTYGAGMRGYANQPGIHVIENPYRRHQENLIK